MNLRKLYLAYYDFPCELNALCNKHAVKVFEKFVDPNEGFSYLETIINADGEAVFKYEQRFMGEGHKRISVDDLVQFLCELERRNGRGN